MNRTSSSIQRLRKSSNENKREKRGRGATRAGEKGRNCDRRPLPRRVAFICSVYVTRSLNFFLPGAGKLRERGEDNTGLSANTYARVDYARHPSPAHITASDFISYRGNSCPLFSLVPIARSMLEQLSFPRSSC